MTTDQHGTDTTDKAMGPNEWLVDEIYEQYKADRNSVDPAWWDFFADYQPGENGIHSPIGTTAVVISE